MDVADIAALGQPGTEIIAPAAVQKTVTAAKVLGNGESTTWRKWKITAVPMYNIHHTMPSDCWIGIRAKPNNFAS
jgi:hypothetical protein